MSIKLFKQINGKKEIEGILKEYDNEQITISCDDILKINRKDISLIKTKFNWE